jgi:DNA-binding HxlR family transcriptional regulator
MGSDAERRAFCPRYHHAIELLGRRWTGAIVRALLHGATRFAEVAEVVPGLSDRMLSERLKELELEGIVARTVRPTTPVRIAYHLTAKGQALGTVVEAVSTWAETWDADAIPESQGCHASARSLEADHA